MGTGDHRIDRDDLLARVDLDQLLDALTTGHGHGHRRTWNCPDPDHPDVHPSVTTHTDSRGTQRWKCWSGGHGGTAIDAVVAARRLSVGEAIRWLNDNYARLDPIDPPPPPRPGRPVGQPAPEVIEYVERCAKLLWTPAGRPVKEWLNDRGYADDVLALNKVGADPGRRYLPRPRGFPGGWPAAVYPALDRTGAITYFQARYLDPPEGRGKYDNPSRRWATNPRLGWVRPASEAPRSTLTLCEGLADAVALATAGRAAVGVLGTHAINHALLRAVKQDAAGFPMAICFDGDDAGRTAATRACELAQRSGIQVAIVSPPSGSDATRWLAADQSAAIDRLDAVARTRSALPITPTADGRAESWSPRGREPPDYISPIG